MNADQIIKCTEAESVARLAAKPYQELVQDVPHIFLPSTDGAWEVKAKPELLPKPLRKSGSIKIHEVDSFIAVSKAQGSLTNTNIYLDVDYAAQRIIATAVFNDDSDGEGAGWKDHRAVFVPRIGEEWKRWNSHNGTRMSQADLAHFLEENVGDIATPANSKLPSGSDVLTFVMQLEETRTVKYGSAINLQNGMVQLEFIEDGDKATKGKLELFKEFAIGLRPFFGGYAYELRAFLRYRINRDSGQISFWYELQRPDRVLESASKELIEKIKESTGFTVIFGEAPSR